MSEKEIEKHQCDEKKCSYLLKKKQCYECYEGVRKRKKLLLVKKENLRIKQKIREFKKRRGIEHDFSIKLL